MGYIIYTLENEKRKKMEETKMDLKSKIKEQKDKVAKWVKNNEVEIIILAPVVLGFVTKMTRIVCRCSSNAKNGKKVKRQVWDYSNGWYYTTRRDLTNDDKIEIARRRRSGEPLTDILESLNLI